MIPSARRLMESLRDIGYDLSVGGRRPRRQHHRRRRRDVRIDVGHDSRRRLDPGRRRRRRHDRATARRGDALRPTRSYGADLGHFGLGLKTASLTQCRRLTVATRSTARGPIRIRRWDLDEVARSDSWDLERLTGARQPDLLIDPLVGTTGTVVLWEELDRILGARRPGGDAAARRLDGGGGGRRAPRDGLPPIPRRRDARAAARHHRRRRPADPWDPFARNEPLTRALPAQTLSLAARGDATRLIVQPFVLPAQHQFSSSEAHRRAGGPNRWNRQQGLYIYRRDRLIQSGGWNRLRTLDEHAKLARIAVDIPAEADAAFRINVAKMSVGLPEDLRPQLRALIAGVVSVAQDAYRRRLTAVGLPTEAELTSQLPTHTPTVGDQWPLISEVLENELHDDPVRLDRILVALANIRPPAGRLERVAASRS